MISFLNIVHEHHLQRTMLHQELTQGVISQLALYGIKEIDKALSLLLAPEDITPEAAILFTMSYKELLQQKEFFKQLLQLRDDLEQELQAEV